MSTTTGSISAATPMSFIKPESTPTVTMITAISRASLCPAKRSTCRPSPLATPVRASPPLRISTARTVTTARLAKPDSASLGVTRPVKARLTNTSKGHHVWPHPLGDKEDDGYNQNAQDKGDVSRHGIVAAVVFACSVFLTESMPRATIVT